MIYLPLSKHALMSLFELDDIMPHFFFHRILEKEIHEMGSDFVPGVLDAVHSGVTYATGG